MTPPPKQPNHFDSIYDNPFPVHVLPDEFRSFVEEGATSLGVDPAMIATPMLAVMASAIGAGVRVQVKPDWREPSILWTMVVASSGSKKSPAIAMVVRPLQEEQAAMVAPIKADHARQVEAARQQGLKPPKHPPLPRLTLNDTTPEALMQALAENPHGVLLYSDELQTVLVGVDRYRSGKGSSVGELLECYGGSPRIVDRKKGGTLFIPRAAASLTGTIQPGILGRTWDDSQFENGLAFRFLISTPTPQKRRFTEASISPQTASIYREGLRRLLAIRTRYPDGLDIPLTPDALALFSEYCNDLGEQIDSATEFVRSVLSKIEGVALRLALVVQMARHAMDSKSEHPLKVSAESVGAGIQIARYFLREALRLHAQAIDQAESNRVRSVRNILKRAETAMTAREIVQRVTQVQTVEEANLILDMLVSHGEVEMLATDAPKGGGRPPGPRYQIRPAG